MIEVKLNPNTTIKLYNSIKEMPITLHNMAQRYLMQDSGIGADMNAVDDHFKQLDALLSANKLEEANKERINLRYNFFVMLEGLDFKCPALACYIHSINDELLTDYSDDALKNLIDWLSSEGLTMGMVEEQLMELKKNFNTN